MTTALITGATSGIGAAFADRLAADGRDLVLVARTREALESTADRLRARHGVAVEVLPADLAVRDDVVRVAERLRDRADPVDLLVNNAGFGTGTAFLDTDLADEERAIAVMIEAVMVLSHAAGNAMRERGRGAIVNVSSVASWLTAGTYSAAKAWVTVFSEGLAGELRPHGVTVTACCPGLTRTDFHRRAGIAFTDRMGPWHEPQIVVDTCLADVRAGRVVSVPGLGYRTAGVALRHLPRAVVRRISSST